MIEIYATRLLKDFSNAFTICENHFFYNIYLIGCLIGGVDCSEIKGENKE